ncbi:YdeI/OmpD-associated family protein [Chitinophaga barathri]|uniref:Bacteriocin-protection protein, YdeI/OmpD-associated family n=1 Tax=Chitinophaga barathri TaxID=1647451 RepID=A0A3N4M524_9BACT|nr:YdeI/OmpD-associated family protein [Chitinophaga barathri]RPD38078.1 hypothetical protein EG028_26540 [Chitinophaga barathri]
METFKDTPAFYAKNAKEWRGWLSKNGEKETAVHLIFYRKDSGKEGVKYEEAVEQALCYGWIDGQANRRDEDSRYIRFTPRKPKGNWSISNRERVERMIKTGQMTKRGQAMIDLAKEIGTWDNFVDPQNTVMPADLKKLFSKHTTALKHFETFPPSTKRAIFEWIATAKRPETRQKRLEETVEKAAGNIRAK